MKVDKDLRNRKHKSYKKKLRNILECKNVDDLLIDSENSDSASNISSKSIVEPDLEIMATDDHTEFIEKKSKISKKSKLKNRSNKQTGGFKVDKVERSSLKSVAVKTASKSENEMLNIISKIVSCGDIENDTTESTSKLIKKKNSLKINKAQSQLNSYKRLAESKSPLENNLDSDFGNMKHSKPVWSVSTQNVHVKEPRTKIKGKPTHKICENVPKILLNIDPCVLQREKTKDTNFLCSPMQIFNTTVVERDVTFHTIDSVPFFDSLAENDGIDTIKHKKSNKKITKLNKKSEIVKIDLKNSHILDCSGDTKNLITKSTTIISNNSESMVDKDNSTLIDNLPNRNNYADVYKLRKFSNFCILTIKQASKLYFCGKLQASLLFGNVETLGHRLKEEFCDLYSVNVLSLLCFETSSINNDSNLDSLINKLVQLDIPSTIIDEIHGEVSEGISVLLLRPLDNVLTQFVSKHLTAFDIFSNSKIVSMDDQYYDSFEMLQCSFHTGNCTGVFVKNKLWDEVCESISTSKKDSRNVTVLCGGKNTGKSTTLRYIVNKILHNGPVLVLDLDPGQPEFTICGLVSATIVKTPLLGPNFTHLQRPEISYSIGLISVVENPDRYMNAVNCLFDFVQTSEECSKIPWIINTMGFTDTLGFQLFMKILDIFKPSNVIEIRNPLNKSNFPVEVTPQNINDRNGDDFSSLYEKPKIIHDYKYSLCCPYQQLWEGANTTLITRSVEAVTERLLNVLGYFSMMTIKSSSLLNAIPFVVPMKKINLAMNTLVVENKYIMHILNGRLVALCNDSNITESTNVFKLDKIPARCLGFGIIRGVDPSTQTLYILTPLNQNILHKDVNLLVYAEALPDCCSMLSAPHLPPKTMIPYVAPMKSISKHKHLHQIPKRKFNVMRLIEIARKA